MKRSLLLVLNQLLKYSKILILVAIQGKFTSQRERDESGFKVLPAISRSRNTKEKKKKKIKIMKQMMKQLLMMTR